ncbi:hypothetical protein HZA99_02705 [Candidatus Woesearchaeota archaeon]|nr:hypothetical protein [Candidatus Woesearchaeota archaeon]
MVFMAKPETKKEEPKHPLHPDKLKEHGQKVAQAVAEGSVIVGQGILKGSQIVSQTTVAAAKGAKEGIVAGAHGFRNFLTKTAEVLHLKKPDFEALDEMEKEVSPYLPTELAKKWYWHNFRLKPSVAKGNLVLNWTRVFCWREDPFKAEMLFPIDNFFILEKEKKTAINRFLIKTESFGAITGEEGCGKTSLLHWIHWELNTHHPEVTACFLDCTNKRISEASLIKQLMYPFLNIYQKTVSRPFEEMQPAELAQYIKNKLGKKPFVLLIDHPYNVSEKSASLFDEIQKAGVTMQIIVAGEKEALKKSSIGKGVRDTLKFELEGLDLTNTAQMLRKRIEAVGGEGTYPFDQQMLKMLRDHAKGNPMQILQLAKEKAIQLSIDHQEEIVAQQQEMHRKREEEIQKKIMEEKQRRMDAREKLRQEREELRQKSIEMTEKQRRDEEARIAAELRNEDAALERIDDMIGTFIDRKEGKQEKEVQTTRKAGKGESEIAKQDSLVQEAVGKSVPEQKSMKQALDEDSSLAKELEQVFAETEKAQKGSPKKTGRR